MFKLKKKVVVKTDEHEGLKYAAQELYNESLTNTQQIIDELKKQNEQLKALSGLLEQLVKATEGEA